MKPPRKTPDTRRSRSKRRPELVTAEDAAETSVIHGLSETFREAVRKHGFKAAMEMLLKSIDDVRCKSEQPDSKQR